MSFFIIGLPRSRTAWLANFMTYDGIYCHHEGINGCHSIEEYKAKIGNDGDSCTGMMLFDLKEHFPDRKILIIESDPKRCIDFTTDALGADGEKVTALLVEKLNALEGLRIGYNDINNRLRDIWEYLSDLPYDEKRGEMLKNLDIQTATQMDLESIEDISSEFQAA